MDSKEKKGRAAIPTIEENINTTILSTSGIFTPEAFIIREATKIIRNDIEKENIVYTDSINKIRIS